MAVQLFHKLESFCNTNERALWPQQFPSASGSWTCNRLRWNRFHGRTRFVQTPNSTRPAAFLFNLDQHPAQSSFTVSHRESRWQIGDKTSHDRLDLAPQNGVHRSAHSRIADERRSVLKNLFVSRLDVGMCAEDGGDTAVEIAADRHFLARCFAVSIDDNDRRLFAHGVNREVEHRKRIFQDRLHESAGLDVNHAHFSFWSLEHDRACSRSAGRIIKRTKQPRLRLDERQDLLAIPDVIAGCDDGDTGAQQINRDFRRYATTSRGVLAVQDDEIQAMLPLQFWQARDHGVATRFANDVAEEKN